MWGSAESALLEEFRIQMVSVKVQRARVQLWQQIFITDTMYVTVYYILYYIGHFHILVLSKIIVAYMMSSHIVSCSAIVHCSMSYVIVWPYAVFYYCAHSHIRRLCLGNRTRQNAFVAVEGEQRCCALRFAGSANRAKFVKSAESAKSAKCIDIYNCLLYTSDAADE